MDMGWKETEQHYYKSKVINIISSILEFLEKPPTIKKPDFKFTLSDVGYFYMFFKQFPDKIPLFKRLLDSGKIEVVGGGFSMADTVCPSRNDFYENLLFGIQYLNRTFGVTPRVAWNIDQFGISNQALQVMKEFRFEWNVIGRVSTRRKRKILERVGPLFDWQFGSGKDSILTTFLFQNHYQTDKPLDDYLKEEDRSDNLDPLVSSILDPRFNSWSVFAQYFSVIREYKLPHVPLSQRTMIPIGGDFYFNNLNISLGLIEELVVWASSNNLTGRNDFRVSLEISTPSEFMQSLKNDSNCSQENFKGGDSSEECGFPTVEMRETVPYIEEVFVPSLNKSFKSEWTGFYSTNPFLKHSISAFGSLQRNLRVLLDHFRPLIDKTKGEESSLTSGKFQNLSFAIEQSQWIHSVNQHHDAVTGTSTSHVEQNYLNRMNTDLRVSRIAWKGFFGSLVILKEVKVDDGETGGPEFVKTPESTWHPKTPETDYSISLITDEFVSTERRVFEEDGWDFEFVHPKEDRFFVMHEGEYLVVNSGKKTVLDFFISTRIRGLEIWDKKKNVSLPLVSLVSENGFDFEMRVFDLFEEFERKIYIFRQENDKIKAPSKMQKKSSFSSKVELGESLEIPASGVNVIAEQEGRVLISNITSKKFLLSVELESRIFQFIPGVNPNHKHNEQPNHTYSSNENRSFLKINGGLESKPKSSEPSKEENGNQETKEPIHDESECYEDLLSSNPGKYITASQKENPSKTIVPDSVSSVVFSSELGQVSTTLILAYKQHNMKLILHFLDSSSPFNQAEFEPSIHIHQYPVVQNMNIDYLITLKRPQDSTLETFPEMKSGTIVFNRFTSTDDGKGVGEPVKSNLYSPHTVFDSNPISKNFVIVRLICLYAGCSFDESDFKDARASKME